MSSPYPVLGDRPIDQWRVTELKDELKRRKLMTKGLKEDLIKRLDEAIRNEQESRNEDNGFGSVLQSEALSGLKTAEVTTYVKPETISIRKPVDNEMYADSGPQVTCEQEQESGNLSVSKGSKDAIFHGDLMTEEVNNHESMDEEVRKGESLDGSDAAGLQDNNVVQVSTGGSGAMISENPESAITPKGEVLLDLGSQNMIPDQKIMLEEENSKPLHSDAKVDESDSNTQVSEVKPVLGFQVKHESVTSETVLIIEKNELKGDVIAEDVKLEQDAKPENVQPSLSNDILKDDEPHQNVEEPHDKVVFGEEAGGNNAEGVDDGSKVYTGDINSSVKFNSDQNSGDDFMDVDVKETKQKSAETVSEERTDGGSLEKSVLKDAGHVDVVCKDMSVEKKVSNAEEKEYPVTPSAKRKLNGQLAVGNFDVAKRQRRWNSDSLKAVEVRTDVVLTSPKNSFQPALKRSFSRSDSSVSAEAPKERVVPPTANPPTNSLRVDNFLRPFTLRAVQELLGKTGTVTDFWMDQIKTHCYVSYSSVEEATETRNAVYNLQWPPNGGRLLVAEYVDPQEVKARLEPSPQSPAGRASSGAGSIPVTRGALPQPSPRPHVAKQQLQQPPPSLPPKLSNPPPVREQVRPPAREHYPPIKERLTRPPSPPLAEKAEQPILTLDDLFKKTRATPRIYYLPLSDEQVSARLQGQGKTVVKQ